MGKPVVAAINRVAAGGGLSLVLACDFRLIGQSASLRQAYTSSGLSMDGGGTFVLPRLIGLARALEIMAFDDPIPAAKALGMGTRHKVRSRSGRPAGILRATGAAGQKLAAFLCLVEKIDGGFVQQHPGNATGAGEAGH